MEKSKFLGLVGYAADRLLEYNGPKRPRVGFGEAHVLNAARTAGLAITASVSLFRCPIVQAIVAAAYERQNPLTVHAAAEAAWEHLPSVAAKAA